MSNETITIEDEAVLSQQDLATLARWWCELNSWGWPSGLPSPMSGEERHANYDELRRPREIMAWIDEAIGHRAVSREWNRDMTEDQFNDFWRGVYEGHAPSRARYDDFIKQRVQEWSARREEQSRWGWIKKLFGGSV